MLSAVKALAVVGLLAQAVNGGGKEVHHDPTTVYDTTTVEKTHYVDVTVYNTKTKVVKAFLTESTTVTLHYTVSVTSTALATVTTTDTDSVTVTNTDSTTITNTDSTTITNTAQTTVTATDTDSTTITTTDTDSTTITTTNIDSTTITNTATATTTTTTTTTIFSTSYNPCPSSCSVSAATVTLIYWPTNRPHAYPATYIDPTMPSYTFTSPSVYMYIPSAQGINTAGLPTGPSTSAWMLGLPLHQVSTIFAGNVTRQLTLADLGTDCPRTMSADPTGPVTVDGRCNPVLAAPKVVTDWAWPCNACGRFGLFDPPYAVPPLVGSLVTTSVGVTTTAVTTGPTVTSAPTPTTTTGVVTAGVGRVGGVGSGVLAGVVGAVGLLVW
ncbi:hypothetical protein OQA88_4385 [Cercophora sp. LCS_1]